MISTEEAVRLLRDDPDYADLVRDAYLGSDILESAERFLVSAEFRAVEGLVGRISDAVVVDVGAGTGIASYAFGSRGARRVYALEPDASDDVGRGAIRTLAEGLPITVVEGYGESIPLDPGTADIVYVRQVLHHAANLEALVADCARILKPGGVFLACREHVVDNQKQLEAFLVAHPLHRLTGGEHAHSLSRYSAAIRAAGFELERVLGPWDSVINAFPAARTEEELEALPRAVLVRRLGRFGATAAEYRFVRRAVSAWLNRPTPGRLYTFLAAKPR